MECFGTCMKMSPVSPVGTCQGSCGKHSPNMKCFCDPTCSYTEDCCDDYQNYCLVSGLRWNESLPLPNMSFKLPAFNISVEDAAGWDDKHVPVADEVDIEGELDDRVVELEARKKREKEDKKAAKSRQPGKVQVSNKGVKDEEE